MSIPIPDGRVETLTNEEELRLKELWAYLLNFWGKPANVSTAKDGKKLLVASSDINVDEIDINDTNEPDRNVDNNNNNHANTNVGVLDEADNNNNDYSADDAADAASFTTAPTGENAVEPSSETEPVANAAAVASGQNRSTTIPTTTVSPAAPDANATAAPSSAPTGQQPATAASSVVNQPTKSNSISTSRPTKTKEKKSKLSKLKSLGRKIKDVGRDKDSSASSISSKSKSSTVANGNSANGVAGGGATTTTATTSNGSVPAAPVAAPTPVKAATATSNGNATNKTVPTTQAKSAVTPVASNQAQNGSAIAAVTSHGPKKLRPLHKRTSSLAESIKRIPSNKEIEGRYTNEMVHSSLKDLKPDEIYENFWNFLKTDSPDNLILRFVRARKWDVDKSLAMIANTLHWRVRESHVDNYLRDGELKLYQEYLESGKVKNAGLFKNFELFKTYIKGHDKQQRPIVVVRTKLHHSSDQTVEEMQLYTLLVIEAARLYLREPVDSASILFDMSDFSLSNMDYSPVKFMISAFEAHYPESLGVLLIHKAPWVFSGIWNIIKNWLDPVVASKVNFTKSTKDLEKFIDAEFLPASLGGKDNFKPKYIVPKEGENDLVINESPEKQELVEERHQLIEKFVKATIKWVEATDADDSAVHLAERIKIGKQLNGNYMKLDKYVRARNIFDRLGLVPLS